MKTDGVAVERSGVVGLRGVVCTSTRTTGCRGCEVGQLAGRLVGGA